jgi:threonine dehydratase
MVETTHSIVIGLDGCKLGWIGARWSGPGHQPDAIFLFALAEAEATSFPEIAVFAIDIPLGLSETADAGGRDCDRQARKFIGIRGSSVFPTPAKSSLSAKTYEDACIFNKNSSPDARSISKQTHALFPKLREANAAVDDSIWLQERLIEIHPEVSFCALATTPLNHSKKKPAGADERRNLLDQAGFVNLLAFEKEAKKFHASTDDALDACVAAWSAWRHAHGKAKCFPNAPSTPNYNMRIWY